MSNPKPVTMPTRPFTALRRATLDALMDLMIPASRDGVMPAATSLGLFDELQAMPAAVRAHFERGLDRLQADAMTAHGRAFAELSGDEANALVDALRSQDRPFVNAFTVHTTARYLQHDQVAIALGLEPRPPWPTGYEVPQGDWGLLEPVRQRGPVWRKA